MKFAYIFDMFLLRFAEYDYTIEVEEGKLVYYAGRDHVHGMLECAGCDAESKWHSYEAKDSKRGYECSFIF